MEHLVETIAVLANGKVYHNTITVKCADRNKALAKARRMLELWKGSDNVLACLTYFADDEENRFGNEIDARAMLRDAQKKGWLPA
jgi:hypothetical protein